MDWTDVSMAFSPRKATDGHNFHPTSMDARKRYNSSDAVHEAPALRKHSASGYRSVLQHMNEMATSIPGEGTNPGGVVQPAVGISGVEPMPQELSDFHDKQRLTSTESLAKSEKSFVETVQEQSKTAIQVSDWENFKVKNVYGYSSISGASSDMVKAQRDRNIELKALRVTQSHVLSPEQRPMDPEEMSFARTLRECNECILCNRFLNMAETFLSLVRSTGNHEAFQLWKALYHMSTLETSVSCKLAAMDEILTYRSSTEHHENIISLARRYLETTVHDSTLNRARHEFRSNSLSEKAHVVVCYTKAHISRQQTAVSASGPKLLGLPVWALIFYSIRLGQLKTAVEFADEGDSTIENFSEYLSDYLKGNGRLSTSKEKELRTIYSRQSLALRDDPFKKAVFAVLSRSDVNEDFADILHSVSDWLWIKLVRIDSTGKDLQLFGLQELVRQKFNGTGGDEAETFLVHVLTGQFEAAIEKLFRRPKYRVHAVHMALVLRHAKILLIVLTSGHNLPASPSLDMTEVCTLDFVSVLKNYVREFRREYPEIVCEYYFHLSDISALTSISFAPNLENMFEVSFFKLAKDTNAVEKLFGRIDESSNGYNKGVIHKFLKEPRGLTIEVAKEMESEGKFAEAVTLFELADEWNVLMKTILRGLCNVMTISVNDPSRKKAQTLGIQYASRFRRRGCSEDATVKNVFLALDMLSFFDMLDKDRYHEAVRTMGQIRIVPVEPVTIQESLHVYKGCLSEVRRCIPDTILYTVRAMLKWYELERANLLGNRCTLSTSFGQLPSAHAFRFGQNPHKLQETFRGKIRPILQFAQKIPSPNISDLMESLLKLESLIC